MSEYAEKIYKETLKSFFGLNESIEPLGQTNINDYQKDTIAEKLSLFFQEIISNEITGKSLEGINKDNEKCARFKRDILFFYNKIKNDFINEYSDSQNDSYFNSRADIILNEKDIDKITTAVAELWSPELAFNEDDKFHKWHLKNMQKNTTPILPEQILIQLNSLYTIPDEKDNDVPNSLQADFEKINKNPGPQIAVYDHPVPLFALEKDHELI